VSRAAVGYKLREQSTFIGCTSFVPGAWHAWCSKGVTGPQAHTQSGTRRSSVTYTYYDYLDLAPGASPARIEAAYAAVLERFQYGASEAGQDLSGLVRMIHAAYEVLSSPQSRKSYDAQLAIEAAEADAELKKTLDARPAEGTRLVQDVPAALRSAITPLAA
jgi:hypothetical protein